MNWLSGAPSKLPENTEMSLRSSVGSSRARRLSITHIALALLAYWVNNGVKEAYPESGKVAPGFTHLPIVVG